MHIQCDIPQDRFFRMRILIADIAETEFTLELRQFFLAFVLFHIFTGQHFPDRRNGLKTLGDDRQKVQNGSHLIYNGRKARLIKRNIADTDTAVQRHPGSKAETQRLKDLKHHPADSTEVGLNHVQLISFFRGFLQLAHHPSAFHFFERMRTGSRHHLHHFHHSGRGFLHLQTIALIRFSYLLAERDDRD